jgi:hypothetical protein
MAFVARLTSMSTTEMMKIGIYVYHNVNKFLILDCFLSVAYDYGVHSALRIILDPNLDEDALSTSSIDGFRVVFITSNI